MQEGLVKPPRQGCAVPADPGLRESSASGFLGSLTFPQTGTSSEIIVLVFLALTSVSQATASSCRADSSQSRPRRCPTHGNEPDGARARGRGGGWGWGGRSSGPAEPLESFEAKPQRPGGGSGTGGCAFLSQPSGPGCSLVTERAGLPAKPRAAPSVGTAARGVG